MAVNVQRVQGGLWITGLTPNSYIMVWTDDNTNPPSNISDYDSLEFTGDCNEFGELYLFASSSEINDPHWVAVYDDADPDENRNDYADDNTPDWNQRIRYGRIPRERPYLPAPDGVTVDDGIAQLTATVGDITMPANFPTLNRWCFEQRAAIPVMEGELIRAMATVTANYADNGTVFVAGTPSQSATFTMREAGDAFRGGAGALNLDAPADVGGNGADHLLSAPDFVAAGTTAYVTELLMNRTAGSMELRLNAAWSSAGGGTAGPEFVDSVETTATIRVTHGTAELVLTGGFMPTDTTEPYTVRTNDQTVRDFIDQAKAVGTGEPTTLSIETAAAVGTGEILRDHELQAGMTIAEINVGHHGAATASASGTEVATVQGFGRVDVNFDAPDIALPATPWAEGNADIRVRYVRGNRSTAHAAGRIEMAFWLSDDSSVAQFNQSIREQVTLVIASGSNVLTVHGLGPQFGLNQLAWTPSNSSEVTAFFDAVQSGDSVTVTLSLGQDVPQLTLKDRSPPTWESLIGTPSSPAAFDVAVVMEGGVRQVFPSSSLAVVNDTEHTAVWRAAAADGAWDMAVAALAAGKRVGVSIHPAGALPALGAWATAMSIVPDHTFTGLVRDTIYFVRAGGFNAAGIQNYATSFGYAEAPAAPSERDLIPSVGRDSLFPRWKPDTEEEQLTEIQLQYRSRAVDSMGNEEGYQTLLSGSIADRYEVTGLPRDSEARIRTRGIGPGGTQAGPEHVVRVGQNREGMPIPPDVEEAEF